MTASWLGAALGLVGALGVLLVITWLPLTRRPTLDQRLAPYLRQGPTPSRLVRTDPVTSSASVLIRLVSPWARGLGRRAERLLGGAESVRQRLVRAGLPDDVDAFRAQQVVAAVGGVVVGGALAAWLWWWRSAPVVPLALLVLVGGGFGAAARDWWLGRQVVVRERTMMAEFPTVAEMVALSVGAGEGPIAALERVVMVSDGPLSMELQRVLADARSGTPVTKALQRLSDRTGLTPLARFVDGVVVAIERGTPLADVLRGQAADAREAGRRALMDAAGTREVAMMVPVVFLVLPITVLFAVFPGFSFLRLDL
ncbi:MAG: type II secretion system F family protein [Angustibacter sp.]